MIVGTTTKRPVISSLALLDRKIVDAGNAQTHQAVLVELPILVTVAAKPVAAVVVPLVGETNREPVLSESLDFLNEPVVKFTLPSGNVSIAARPSKNSALFRQQLSVV